MVNGSDVRPILWLIGALLTIDIGLTGWSMTNIVEIKMIQSSVVTTLDEFKDSRFTAADGRLLLHKIDNHVHER